jgi:small-conductance mechanosensitive channel
MAVPLHFEPSAGATASRQRDLYAALVAFAGSIIAFAWCMDITSPAGGAYRVVVALRPGYATLAWGILSVSTALFYLFRSGGSTTSGGYIDPLFKRVLNIAGAVPFVGLALSFFGVTGSASAESAWSAFAAAASGFMDSMLILFIAVNFSAGIGAMTRYWRTRRAN